MSIHATDVECPTCHAWVGWACKGSDYGYHAAGYHPSRQLAAESAAAAKERKTRSADFEGLIARSSIGAAIADVKARGINAHLVDLEREMNKRWSGKKPAAKKLSAEGAVKKLSAEVVKKSKKLSAEDAAFMRGFGTALASIWRCHHDSCMVRQLIKENNFTLASFKGVGMLDGDYEAICKAVRR